MYIVKYQDATQKVMTETSKSDKQEAIKEAERIRKPGRWVIVFDNKTKKQVYNERD